MKRDAVMTCLLLANVCLLVYISVLVWQKPSLQEIDARIDYWHNYYEVQLKRLERAKGNDKTKAPADEELAATDFVQTPKRDESGRALKPADGSSAENANRVDQEQGGNQGATRDTAR